MANLTLGFGRSGPARPLLALLHSVHSSNPPVDARGAPQVRMQVTRDEIDQKPTTRVGLQS